jgi:hypothetical protein
MDRGALLSMPFRLRLGAIMPAATGAAPDKAKPPHG